jgi:hypothetical protein
VRPCRIPKERAWREREYAPMAYRIFLIDSLENWVSCGIWAALGLIELSRILQIPFSLN